PELVYGIYRIPIEQVNGNSYIVVRGNEALIVDTGTPGNAGRILKEVESLGGARVSAIVLTHYHLDHSGSAADLRAATGARVYVHEADAPFVSGRERPPLPPTVPRETLSAYSSMKPVEPDSLLRDGDVVLGFRVIHAPGHTPGSIVLHDGRALFAGDNINVRDGSIQGSPAPYDWDGAKARESLGKLLELDFDLLLPGHGPPVLGDAAEKARRSLRR
ncbi:MAG: MBL fold metallo-hydrolase, partial [Conexivisphaera sp.]